MTKWMAMNVYKAENKTLYCEKFPKFTVTLVTSQPENRFRIAATVNSNAIST